MFFRKIELKPRVNANGLFRRCNPRAVRMRQKGRRDRKRSEVMQDNVWTICRNSRYACMSMKNLPRHAIWQKHAQVSSWEGERKRNSPLWFLPISYFPLIKIYQIRSYFPHTSGLRHIFPIVSLSASHSQRSMVWPFIMIGSRDRIRGM